MMQLGQVNQFSGVKKAMTQPNQGKQNPVKLEQKQDEVSFSGKKTTNSSTPAWKRAAMGIGALMMLSPLVMPAINGINANKQQNRLNETYEILADNYTDNIEALDGKEPVAPSVYDAKLEEKISLTDALNDTKPVVLAFYYDECPYCIEEAPVLDMVGEELGENVNFVMVNIKDETDLNEFIGSKAAPLIEIPMSQGVPTVLSIKSPVDIENMGENLGELIQQGDIKMYGAESFYPADFELTLRHNLNLGLDVEAEEPVTQDN